MAPDINETAKRIVDEATGETVSPASAKDPAAVALGRRGGLKGGRARAESMTPEQRTAAARHAARARWGIEQAQFERLHRSVPTATRFPYDQRAAHRITAAGPCAFCGRKMERGEICTITTGPRGPVCTSCRPLLCSVADLGLYLPTFPDPRLWWPGDHGDLPVDKS